MFKKKKNLGAIKLNTLNFEDDIFDVVKMMMSTLDRVPAEPQISFSSVQDFRTGSGWFNPRLGQYSFQGLMMVIATGFIPL